MYNILIVHSNCVKKAINYSIIVPKHMLRRIPALSSCGTEPQNIDRNIFFTVKEERRTRGHGVTLAKKQCRLDIRKFSFSQRTVNEWNRLSPDCVGASSVNIFKNKIDIYLRRAGYT